MTALLTTILVCAAAGAGARTADTVRALYDRSVDRALERAQDKLVRSTELWQDHSTWETRWIVRSQFYEVHTIDSRYLAADLGSGLDTMLAHMRTLLPAEREITEPFVVYVLPTLADYNQFGSNAAEHSSFYGSFFAGGRAELPVASLYDRNPTRLRMWVTHSAVHQYAAWLSPRQLPAWADEGLASYFAFFWDFSYGISEFERISADSQQYVPLRQLLAENLPAYTDRTHARLIELGMLFSYLLSYREDTRTIEVDGQVERAPFADYLRKLVAGRPLADDPVHALLTSGLDELERDLRSFDFRP